MDYDEKCSRREEVEGFFNKYTQEEFLEFEKIPQDKRLSERKDLCAFLYLYNKFGGESDVVAGADHDVIYLGFDNVEELTEEDVLYITRCGVLYDEENDSLMMYC